MAKGVLMPKAGISVESCIITEWLKQPGDTVAEGDILFSYETDKASFECESTEAGTLLEIFFENGDEVPVLVNVCAVGNPGEDTAGLRPDGGGADAAGAAAEAPASVAAPASAGAGAGTPVPAAAPVAAPAASGGGELRISPRARNLAAGRHVDPGMAQGTGPYGRVIERDIRALIDSGAAATSAAYGNASGLASGTALGGRVGVADLGSTVPASAAQVAGAREQAYEDIAFSGIRRAISKSMTASLSTIPQLTHNFSFNAAELMAYRQKVKQSGEALGLPNITLGDMVMFAVSRLLYKYPALNAHMLDGNNIRQFRNVDLGFACDTERGLVVPVIRNACCKSLAQISREVKELAKQAVEGTLSPDAMSGATFTVSNLGAFGVESFTPVINPPQTGILGVDNIVKRPYEKADGSIGLYPAMGLSITYDHRAIDGAPASRFVQELCGLLENFPILLAQ